MKRYVNGKLMDSMEGIQELIDLSAKVEGLINCAGDDQKIVIRANFEILAGSKNASCVLEASQNAGRAKRLMTIVAKAMSVMGDLEDLFEEDLIAEVNEDYSSEE